ncbi:MAG: hypothetical protein M9962_11795 [Oligoflexia bacterium]|nr:hypothetical protein [Oligoflexia bacterium]
MRYVILINLLLTIFIFPSFAKEETELHRYDCVMKTPDELVKISKTLFSDVKAVAQNGQVLFYTSKEKFQEIQKILKSIDQKAVMYTVQFKIKSNTEENKRSAAISGGIAAKDKAISVGDGSNKVNINVSDESKMTSGESIQSIKVSSGIISQVKLGDSSGKDSLFFKLIEMKGKSVEIAFEISSDQAKLDFKNTVRVDVGKWQSIGFLQDDKAGKKKTLLSSASGNTKSEKEVLVMATKEKE